MENASIETKKPRIARKYRLPIIAILMISAIVVGVFAAILFTQNYTYTVGTQQPASVSGPTTLDFGTLSGDSSSSKLFTSALAIGPGSTSSITFAFVNPTTTWSTVFSGISIVAQTQATVPVGVACISLGTGTCPSTLTAAFIPAASTHYDYLASFTVVGPTPASGMILQTTWSDTIVAAACPLPVNLGTAATYGVLASSTITSTGTTAITGDLGLSPGTAITGTITQTGTRNVANAAAATAIADLTTALTSAQGLTPAITVATALGGQTLPCGVYNSAAGTLAITGTLTLDAKGDPNAVWVFQMASTLTTAAGANIVLINGATANHVFFAVGSSATLGATNTFNGTIMALASATIGAGTTVNGRILAETAAVTLDSDTITVP
jgi:hypothetical protein